MKIVCVPDSFKGSLTGAEATMAMARGARQVMPEAEVVQQPFADGGEGTLDALMAVWGQSVRTVEAVDALRRPCIARYGLSPDGHTAIIEAAEAIGLPRVADVPQQPRLADTCGVGQIASHVLDIGVEEILLCIGGSATTDGGTGMITALGGCFLDSSGRKVPSGGGALSVVSSVKLEDLHPRASEVRWRIASDVDNPLTGPRGAAAVFGPQKGADDGDVAALDAGLHHLADILAEASGEDAGQLRTRRGFGAAGGIPVALVSLLDAEVVPGATLVADAIGLAEVLDGADLVLTGEGRLDNQSLGGKVVDAVALRAPEGAVVVAIAGGVQLRVAECRRTSIAAAFSIAPGAASLCELQQEAANLVEQTAAHVTSLFTAATRGRRSSFDLSS